jgi:hypothetical protein
MLQRMFECLAGIEFCGKEDEVVFNKVEKHDIRFGRWFSHSAPPYVFASQNHHQKYKNLMLLVNAASHLHLC